MLPFDHAQGKLAQHDKIGKCAFLERYYNADYDYNLDISKRKV